MSTPPVNKFTNPLVYVDPIAKEDQAAFDIALSYASQHNTPLTIVTSVKESNWTLLGHSAYADMVYEEESLHAEHKLTELKAWAGHAGVNCQTEMLRGVAHVEIIRKAIKDNHDIVFKTMLGDNQNTNTTFGFVAKKLLRKLPGTLFLVHPECNDIERVVLTLAPNVTRDEDHVFSQSIASTAHSWAQHSQADLLALHVWNVYGEAMMSERLQESELYKYLDNERKAASDFMDIALDKLSLDIPKEQAILIEGEPDVIIPNFATNPVNDLIVMGSVARAGVRGLLLGNTAESILEKVSCSIMVVKPEDFVSPIQ